MVSQKMKELGQKSSIIREIFEYGKKRKAEIGTENVFDFSLGNPSVPAPEKVTQVLKNLIDSTSPELLHAYTSAAGDMQVRQTIADYLCRTYRADVLPELIYMTCGAAASLTIILTALVCEGDEVIVFAPFFPEYRVFTERTGAKLVPVMSRAGDFQIDPLTFECGITPSTKAVIVNSPNNPTGAVLTEKSINEISKILSCKEKEYGHAIYLISDEPYRELVYGTKVPYLTKYYADTIISYSFSKSLSIPGERIGYVLVSPKATDCMEVFYAISGAGRALGFVCAPALFQYMVRDCLGMTADLSIYETNRNLLYKSLVEYGYEVVKPEGAFYMFVKSPQSEAYSFCEQAKKYELLVVPSDDFGYLGYVRIAYCVSTQQIINSLPAYKKLAEEYGLIER